MKKNKIIIVDDIYLHTNLAGLKSYTETQINFLKSENIPFDLISNRLFFLPRLLSNLIGIKRMANLFSLFRIQYFDDECDIIHYFDTYHFASSNRENKSKIYVTLHDLSSIVLPETYSLRSKIYKIQSLLRCKKHNVKIISISEKTAIDLYRLLNIGSSFVIHNPIKFNIPDNYKSISDKKGILMVGSYHKRKNYEKLLSYWKPNYPMLNIVGKTLKQLNSITLPKNICLNENISDNELFELYSSSYGLINASIDEGFCLPVFEMLQIGGLVFDFGDLQIINEFEVNNYYKLSYDQEINFNINIEEIKVISKFPSTQYKHIYEIDNTFYGI